MQSGPRKRNRTNLSLRAVRVIGSSHTRDGLRIRQQDKVMCHSALVANAAKSSERKRARLEGAYVIISSYPTKYAHVAMTQREREALEELCQGIQNHDREWVDDEPGTMSIMIDSVLDGTECLDISHSGKEFLDLAREIMGDFTG